MARNRSPNRQWQVLFQRSLERRLRADLFEQFAKELYQQRAPLPGRTIASILLTPQHDHNATSPVDPLILVYVNTLLNTALIDTADVLAALLSGSRHRPASTDTKESQDGIGRDCCNPSKLEEFVLDRVLKHYRSGERPKTVAEARRALYAINEWMSAMVTSGTSDSVMDAMSGGNQQMQLDSAGVREALGVLIIGMMDNQKIVAVLEEYVPKVVRQKLSESLSLFIPFLAQTSIQVANMLESHQKQRLISPDPLPGAEGDASLPNSIDDGAMQVDAVLEVPMMNSRAGLYVFINSLLYSRPLTDETMMLSYLHARYKGDIQSLTVDLVVASFDISANAVYRSDSSQSMFVLRSFLVNKVPILISTLSGSMFPPLTPEFCIREAFNRVDPNAFPSFSQSFDIMNNSSTLSDVRQDFLLACALHQLIPEAIIEQLLGEPPMSGLPTGGRYIRDNLVSQCFANSDKAEELVNELESPDGNAGAIVGALTDVIRIWSSTKETMSLKTLCLALCRKPQTLDVLVQFTSPSSILHPLCTLLDTWRYEEDQGEYQPVYDEFGAILLLVVAMVYRFELSYLEIGIAKSSFVAQLLQRGHMAIYSNELTEDQNKHLSGWIKGLFNPESMSDEVMSACRPQEFYMLVPTLFYQTVFACSTGVLSTDTMNGGLEYFLETFLLPSLVGAITWITTYARVQTNGDLNVLLPMINKLIRPASISGDAQSMHGTIIPIIAPRLFRCLNSLKRREPKITDIDPLFEVVRPHLQSTRSSLAFTNEIELWASNPGPNLYAAVRSTMRSLVLWSSTPPTITVPPPSYTHKLLTTAIHLLGARRVLRALLDEIKAQTEAGSGPYALDIATSLICSPSLRNSPLAVDWPSSAPPPPGLTNAGDTSARSQPPPRQPRHPRASLNLHDALKLELEDPATLFKTEILLAESAVRLSRRVEGQLAATATAAATAAAAAAVGVGVGVSASGPGGTGMEGLDGMEGILTDGMDLSVANAVADAATAAAAAAGVGGSISLQGGAGGMDGMEGLLGLDGSGDVVNTIATTAAAAAAAADATAGSNAGTAAGAGTDLLGFGDGTKGLDIDMDIDMGMSNSVGGDGAGGSAMPTGEDDIWAGLDLDQDYEFGGLL